MRVTWLAGLFLAGCSNIFFTDFEGGPVGQSPLSPPPGPPAGDSISNGPDDAFFVTASAPLADAQSLAIRAPEPSLDDTQFTTTFRSIDLTETSAPVYFSWRAAFPESGPLSVNAGIVGESFGNITFDNGTIRLFDDAVGGYGFGGTHTILVSVFPEFGIYRMTISGIQLPEPGFVEGELRPLEGAGTPHAFLEVTVGKAAGQPIVHVMDNVTISRMSPE